MQKNAKSLKTSKTKKVFKGGNNDLWEEEFKQPSWLIQLKMAITSNDLSGVHARVNKGADIHYNNDLPLYWASSAGDLQIVKYLVEKGANIAAVNYRALRSAILAGHINIVKYFVEKGADIHFNNDEAIRFATEIGNIEIVNYLSAKGASASMQMSSQNLSNREALRILKEKAIAEEKGIEDSVLQYIGLLLHLLYTYEQFYELEYDEQEQSRNSQSSSYHNCSNTFDECAEEYYCAALHTYISPISKIFGMSRNQLVTCLTNIGGTWILVLPKNVDLTYICDNVLNATLQYILKDLGNTNLYDLDDLTFQNLCKTMQIHKFAVTLDKQGLEILRQNLPSVPIIIHGNHGNTSVVLRYEDFKDIIHQSVYDDIFQKFYNMFQQYKSIPHIQRIEQTIKGFISSSYKLNTYTVAYMMNMPYSHVNKSKHIKLMSDNCLLMKAVDVWKSYMNNQFPAYVHTLYSGLNKDYIEVYSGRNMIYSTSGRALSTLKGKHVYMNASLSTSIAPYVSLAFLARKSSPLFLKIKIPRNAFLESLPIKGIEPEVLLPIGTKLFVDNVYPCKGNEISYLVVEATLCVKDNLGSEIFKTLLNCDSYVALPEPNLLQHGSGKPDKRKYNDIGVFTMKELYVVADKTVKDYIKVIDYSQWLFKRFADKLDDDTLGSISEGALLTADKYAKLKKAISNNEHDIPTYYVVLFAYYGDPRTGYVSFEECVNNTSSVNIKPSHTLDTFYKDYYNGDMKQRQFIEDFKRNEAILYFENVLRTQNKNTYTSKKAHTLDKLRGKLSALFPSILQNAGEMKK